MSSYEVTRLANIAKVVINPATEEGQDDLLAELELKADLTETQPVSAASLPLPAGASTEAKQDDAITQLVALLAQQLNNTDQVDPLTDAVVTIGYPHKETHAGDGFTAHSIAQTGTSLIIAFRVAPSQAKEAHMTLHWKSEETAVVRWWRGATWTTGTGTASIPVNSHDSFQGVKTSILQGDASGAFVSDNVVIGPTGLSTAGATEIFAEPTWGTNQSPAGTSSGSRDERVQEPGETYVIEVTSESSGGAWIYLTWYEHTNPLL